MKTDGIQLIAELNGCDSSLLDDRERLGRILSAGIERCGFHQISLNSHKFTPVGLTIIAIISESHIAIHTYPEAHHASVDIFHCSNDSRPLHDLLHYLKENFCAHSIKFMEVTRGQKLELQQDNYLTSPANYGFEVRYHFTKMLYSAHSPFQKIEVIQNENFGRMLFLDGDLQIAEKDVHLYNQTMVAPLVIKNKLGEVAILGGGDGGVLAELLQHSPSHVTLVDIDQQVIRVAKDFFPMVCGQAFDRENVTVVVEDANIFLAEDRRFGAIIYDLTMSPELLTNKDKNQFLNDMFKKINRNLQSGGVLSMQCCSEYDQNTFRLIRDKLEQHFSDVRFKTVYIPSYCEPWIFGSATKS